MIEKDFWLKANIAVIGGGSWGSVLAHLASQNCAQVRMWIREEERARSINSTRTNPDYVPELVFNERVRAYSDVRRVFEVPPSAIIWALPSSVCRSQAKALAHHFRGDEIILHATKGVEEGSLRRISEVLRDELPCPRIGVISGPNLAHEVGRNEPAATVIASDFNDVVIAGQSILSTSRFRVYGGSDVIGAEWAGTLKNVLAIAAGALDALKLGWNARAMLITRGLAEMVRFGVSLGAEEATFLGLSGIGDLLATCSSPLSRNYRVGMRLAQGEKIEGILKNLGSTAEGVRTTLSVREYAKLHKIDMPITEGVYHLLRSELSAQEIMHMLMVRPQTAE